ncbi:TraK domain-containing protein [Thiorhodovibrio frisius]|uniref:TraK protein n=1 Tax=Thiorhodovibrio frisius TaxID=631362 RepID=H8YVE0_9GAMM|nr:type-F conjugative transfer system secretin TraK [Thiorhodovibrio frisius]EIC23880.1 TraK protein [Thiorhodovibrio frisius]WPL23124.1 conjugal transfer protein TraK [Thiorhodovibrio frisius]
MHFQPRRLTVSIQAALLGTGLAVTSLGSQAASPFLRTSADSNPNQPATTKDAQLALGPRTVTVEPGSTVILELAIDHLNRIVTPFRSPSVRTVSSVSTEVDGNVLYVATAEETPATLYITDADDAQTTVALTLAPRRVPPREIRLLVPGLENQRKASRPSSAVTESASVQPDMAPVAIWRQPQQYVAELTQGFRALALGEVPDGYRSGRVRFGPAIRCGADVNLSQVKTYDGDALRFLTARVRVKGDQPVVLDESQCQAGGKGAIAAAALWPSGPLHPGADATLLVAIDPSRANPAARTAQPGGTR